MMKSLESFSNQTCFAGCAGRNVSFVRFLHFATNATWSILGAARLFFVRVLSDHSINQTNKQLLYLRVNHGI